MNRLIILGNGFDLAHGLKTRYNDFILWYLKKCYEIALDKGRYEDDLLIVEKSTNQSPWIGHIKTASDIIDHLYRTKGFVPIVHNDSHYYFSKAQDMFNPFKTTIKYDFIKRLLLKCSFSSWVEVENEYYEQLKLILHSGKDAYKKPQILINLNMAFDCLTHELKEYLSTIQPATHQSAFNEIFNSPIYKDDIINTRWDGNIQASNIMILNFNYTATVEQYIQDNPAVENIKVNYIHGKLNDPNNPIIFGFGDELDADYAKMELEKIPGYFKHIKSFGYFKTSNYYNLIRFLDSGEYQVFILGHSCGLSDRTMLNMVFEHDNCKSIKIYYYEDQHGVNNFTPLTEEISRHFKDKAMMRRKIVPFDKSSPMPQV